MTASPDPSPALDPHFDVQHAVDTIYPNGRANFDSIFHECERWSVGISHFKDQILGDR